MPLPVEALTPDSDDAAVKAAISESIAQCMREGGRSQEQCTAMAFSMARDHTNTHLGSEGKAKIRTGLK